MDICDMLCAGVRGISRSVAQVHTAVGHNSQAAQTDTVSFNRQQPGKEKCPLRNGPQVSKHKYIN